VRSRSVSADAAERDNESGGAISFSINGVESYSDWTAGEPLAPTAANASVIGQVRDAQGRGVYGARVVIQSQDGTILSALTNPFGSYRIDGCAERSELSRIRNA
jgi:hypothetical protein